MIVILLLFSIFFHQLAFPQDVDLEPITIEKFFSPTSSLSVESIPEDTLENTPVFSVEEIVEYASSVDLQKRFAFGVQQDVSLRGSSFEDTKISLGGIKINDPQTGHFNLEIPLTAADIQQVQVLKNSQKINFVLKRPSSKEGIVGFSFGEHGLWENLLSINFPIKEIKNRISIEHKISSGDRQDTDFEIYNFSSHSFWRGNNQELEFLFGATDRDFGADSFYSTMFPHEKEHIRQQFYSFRHGLTKKSFKLNNTIYFRRHEDEFVLNRHNPLFYKNNHTTYVYGFNNQIDLKNNLFINFDIEKEKINSSNLSKHHRLRKGFSAGIKDKQLGSFTIGAEAGLDYYEQWKYLDNFQFSLGYKVTDKANLRFSFDRLWRAPSFTELYYMSPANIGNPNLDVQKANNFEWGFDYSPKDGVDLGLSFFLRKQSDTIDWVKNTSAAAWRAQNVGKIDVYGIDVFSGIDFDCFLSRWDISYTYLELEQKNPFNFSKYIFDYNRHKVVNRFGFNIKDFKVNLITNFSKPVQRNEYITCDLKIEKRIKNWIFAIEGINIFNEDYDEMQDIPGVGRWYKISASLEF